MEDMSVASLMYIFFRLAPFLIVGYMTLGSVINGQVRGFVYLVGLCFSMAVTYLCASGMQESGTPNFICNNFSLNGLTNNKMPVGLAVMAYTFFYLIYPVAKYKLEVYNIPLLIVFPLLLISEILWNFQHGCFGLGKIILTIFLAGGLGVTYSVIIDQLKMPKLMYLSAGSTREVCNLPQKQKFKCVNHS